MSVVGDGLWRKFSHPLASCKNCNCDRDTEECLRYGSMCRGNCRGKKLQHGHAAENPLRNDRGESSECQRLHPAAAVPEPGPEGDHNRAKTREPRNHPVAVLINNAAHPGRKPDQMTI